MPDTSTRLDLPYIQPSQAQKHVTHNEALRVLDALVQLSVNAFDATVPPATPEEGEIYALGAGPVGDWAGHGGALALFADGYWHYYTPQPGWLATLAGGAILRVWTGSAWEAPSPDVIDNMAHLGVNTSADTVNRLAVSAPSSLFTHEGSDHRMKINKASATDTATLLFQSNWSGRAEMGLAGADRFSFKVSADGSAWVNALEIEPATGRIAAAELVTPRLELDAIATDIAATAIDVCIYDSGKDSDGGLWRDRAEATSWLGEPLNTATRGARAAFPAVSVIVAESDRVTIHDADDPGLAMWRVHDFTGYTVTSVAARDGVIVVGLDGAGLAVIDYPRDALDSAPRYDTTTTPALVDDTVNGVMITGFPAAPIDGESGLPAATIFALTDGGVSQIGWDGAVADVVRNITGTRAARGAMGTPGRLWVSTGTSGQEAVSFGPVPVAADVAMGAWRSLAIDDDGATPPLIGVAEKVTQGAVGCDTGLVRALEDSADPGASAVAHVTSSYVSGWMPGDIKGAWLADTDTSDLVGGSDADRSMNGNDLTVNGTVMRMPVASGAELACYGGFSTSDYLSQPYSADMDFGTGDFCAMGWAKLDSTPVFGAVLARSDTAYAGNYFEFGFNSGGIQVYSSAGHLFDSEGYNPLGSWSFIVVARKGGVFRLYQDGVELASVANSANFSNATAQVVIGAQADGSNYLRGCIALCRLSASAPSAAQIAHYYQTERALFAPGADCTLDGGSNAITALAQDREHRLLHVGTSAGRSTFRGLRRLSSTGTPVSSAIAASGGLIVEQ